MLRCRVKDSLLVVWLAPYQVGFPPTKCYALSERTYFSERDRHGTLQVDYNRIANSNIEDDFHVIQIDSLTHDLFKLNFLESVNSL